MIILFALSVMIQNTVADDSWTFYEFDSVYLSTTQDNIISFDLAPLYQSKEYQRGATVDIDKINGDYAYHEISFDEPVSHDELTDKCSGFCGASTLDVSNYYVKTSGYCTDDGGHYIDTIEECRDAFSSTGTTVDEVLKFKLSTFGRGQFCHDYDVPAARTFSGTCDYCKLTMTDGGTNIDTSPSVRYNCYLSCLDNYQNKDGAPFIPDNVGHRCDVLQCEDGFNFFNEYLSRSFYVNDDGRCYCLSHDTGHCGRTGVPLDGGSSYENYDIPTVPFCTAKDSDIFFKTPYTDMQRERECGEDGFNCLCRRKKMMKEILSPEKSRDSALHATFVGNGYCPDSGGGVYEMGVNCPDGELFEVDGVNKCLKPRIRLLGFDWKYTSDNGAAREHPIGQEECEQECLRRGCTYYSVSVALNKCRFSYDDSCNALHGVESDETRVYASSITAGLHHVFPQVMHFKRFTWTISDNLQRNTVAVKVWEDSEEIYYQCNADVSTESETECSVAGDKVYFGSSLSNVAMYRHPTWKSYKMDRNIVKIGNYTGELRLMETIWDESNPKCRCYASENELPLKAQSTSSLFTVYTGEFVSTWDKSLFYKRDQKNPFVCNYESYSEYGDMTSDSCGCGGDIALAEMDIVFGSIPKRTITYAGSDIPGDTLEDRLQYCAKSCLDKLFISDNTEFHNPQWLRNNDADMFTMMTSGPLTGQCICFKKSDVDEEEGNCPDTELNCLGRYVGTYQDGSGEDYNMDWEAGKQRCEQQGYRLCSKYDIATISLCNHGWTTDDTVQSWFWRKTWVNSGCGVGWMSKSGLANAHCCEHPNEGYKTYKILTGCSCAGTFILNHKKELCPSGSFNAGSCRDECTQCPRGYFQSEEGRISCDICPEGYFQDTIGRHSCKACTNFCYEDGIKGAGTVGTCLPGSTADSVVCEACTHTRFLVQDSTIYLTQGMRHAHGSYPPKEITIDNGEACITCPLGWYDTYAPQGWYDNVADRCVICPVGKFGKRGIATGCLDCQSGFYQPKEGQSECTVCDPGKYQNEEAQTSCIDCPVGKAREAYFPHNDKIMKKQGLLQECLTCGSMGPDAAKPGCVYCNQYQDEAGQQRCKRCPMNPSGQWQIYSYVDRNNIPYTQEGSCKYAENLQFWWERRREVNPRPDGMRWGELEWCGSQYADQPFSSEEEKKQFQNWTACVYASSTWTGRRYPYHFLMEYDDWFGDYNYYKEAYTLQGYDEDCPRSGYADFYTSNFLDITCDTTISKLQYAAYGSDV